MHPLEAKIGRQRAIGDLLLKAGRAPLYRRHQAEFRASLEYGNIIDITHGLPWQVEIGLRPGASMDEKLDVLHLEKTRSHFVSDTSKLDEWLANSQERKRANEWVFRFGEEAWHLAKLGWYGLFVTLTVDPKAYDAYEIMSDPRYLRDWRYRMAEIVRRALGERRVGRGGPPRATYFRSALVIEHGKSRHHHHCHGLVWVRAMPEEWLKDPNEARPIPDEDEIRGFRQTWPYGQQKSFRALRHDGDAYTKLGWQWPLVDGKPLDRLAPESVGSYLGKYLGKDHKEWNHRVKCTRDLGLATLRDALRGLRLSSLWAATRRNMTMATRAGSLASRLPTSLRRSQAMRMLISRLSVSPIGRKRMLVPWAMRPSGGSYSAMQESVRRGARPWSMDGVQLWEWLTEVLPPPGGRSVFSDRSDMELLELFRRWPELGSPGVAQAGISGK